MISYVRKTGKRRLTQYILYGASSAVAISLILGWIAQVLYGELRGVTAKIFEGSTSLLAMVVLTYMIFWMTKHSKKIKSELQQKIDIAITTRELFGITTLAFIVVFREGLETVLFLTAAFFLDPSGVIVGAAAGSAVIMVLATLLMKGAYRLPLRKFFKYTSVLLINLCGEVSWLRRS